MAFDHDPRDLGSASSASASARPSPGKVSRTQRLAAVQRKTDEVEDVEGEVEVEEAGEDAAGAIHAIAAEGVSGAGGSLPFLDEIQRAFGHHDVSGLEAHTDAAAGAAARGLGAKAYAAGNHVAFDGAPDLHTAAHEAAHVVQQRGGVQLKGGVGAAGDRYERHADAVADLVVQGKSAEGLLDQMAGGGGSSGAVQRKEKPAHLAQVQGTARTKVDATVTPIAEHVRKKLGVELGKILTKDRHDQLVAAGKAAAEDQIGDASFAQKDARAQAEKLAKGVVPDDIKAKAQEVADAVAAPVKGELTTAATGAIDAAQPGKVFDTTVAELVAKAKTAAVAKARAGKPARLTDGKARMAEPTFVDELTRLVEGHGRDEGQGELTTRNQHDQKVAALIKAPIETSFAAVHTAVQSFLETQVGAHGTKLLGPSSANEFRKKMKQAAREQAYHDIDQINDGSGFTHVQPGGTPTQSQQRMTGAGQATKHYFRMQGKAQAYDDAKLPVNAYLLDLAHKGTNKLLDAAATETAIHEKASIAAWTELRSNPKSMLAKQAAARAATAAATKESTAQQTTLLAPGTGPAAKWIDDLIKDKSVDVQDDQGVDENLALGGSTAQTQVAQKIEDEHVGSKALSTAIEAESVGTGLTLLGGLLDVAVPNSGEGIKLGVELKIPVPQAPGVFCVVKIEGVAERHGRSQKKHGQTKLRNDLELTVNLELGAGFEMMGLSTDGRVVLFLKARGGDTDKALKMMSYGVYRDLCSNPLVPQSLATWWATGKAARTGEYSKDEEAETWAAMVEEYAMTGTGSKDAFVEAGEALQGQAKAKLGILDVGAKAQLGTMRHWDKKSLKTAGYDPGQLDHTGDKNARKQHAIDKRKAVSGGQRRGFWNFEGQCEFEAGGQKFAGQLKMQQTFGEKVLKNGVKKRDSRLGFLDLELSGGLPYDPSNPSSSTMLSQIASQYVPSALSAIRQIYDRAIGLAHQDEEDHSDVRTLGTVVDMGGEVFGGLDTAGITGNLGKQLTDIKLDGSSGELVNSDWAGKLGLMPDEQLTNKVSQHAMKSMLQLALYRKDGAWGVSLAEVKQLELGIGDRAGVGVSAKVSGEKTKKIFSIGQDGPNNW